MRMSMKSAGSLVTTHSSRMNSANLSRAAAPGLAAASAAAAPGATPFTGDIDGSASTLSPLGAPRGAAFHSARFHLMPLSRCTSICATWTPSACSTSARWRSARLLAIFRLRPRQKSSYWRKRLRM